QRVDRLAHVTAQGQTTDLDRHKGEAVMQADIFFQQLDDELESAVEHGRVQYAFFGFLTDAFRRDQCCQHLLAHGPSVRDATEGRAVLQMGCTGQRQMAVAGEVRRVFGYRREWRVQCLWRDIFENARCGMQGPWFVAGVWTCLDGQAAVTRIDHITQQRGVIGAQYQRRANFEFFDFNQLFRLYGAGDGQCEFGKTCAGED